VVFSESFYKFNLLTESLTGILCLFADFEWVKNKKSPKSLILGLFEAL